MFQKIKFAFMNFMRGRHGADQLSRFLLWVWLAFYLLSLIPYCWFLSYFGLAVILWSLFRMFSRNTYKRQRENEKYLALTSKFRTSFSQAKARFRNRKEYKYFRCPGCKSWLKLRRGAGEGTLRCSKCGHSFKVKA